MTAEQAILSKVLVHARLRLQALLAQAPDLTSLQRVVAASRSLAGAQLDATRLIPLIALLAVSVLYLVLRWVPRAADMRATHKWNGISIFVDLENCPQVTPEFLKAIRTLALDLGSRIERFNVYGEIHSSPKHLAVRTLLSQSGATLIDTPHNGRKETADKVLLYDLAAAIGRRQASAVLLVTDDADFSMPISRAQLMGVRVARAGFQRAATEVIQADRSFIWSKPDIQTPGSFIEVKDAITRDDFDFTAPPASTNTASALASRFSERETLLVCRPFLLLLSLFFVPGGRDAVPADIALLELGWPTREDGVNIQARSGSVSFKGWVDRATELGLVKMVGTQTKHLLKLQDADWVWSNAPDDWKSELPPLLPRSPKTGKNARNSRRRSRVSHRVVDEQPTIGSASESSSRQMSHSPEASSVTPPTSAPPSPLAGSDLSMPAPKLMSAFSDTLVPRTPTKAPLSRSVSVPLFGPFGTPRRDRCTSLVGGATASPGVGLRLRLLAGRWTETDLDDDTPATPIVAATKIDDDVE